MPDEDGTDLTPGALGCHVGDQRLKDIQRTARFRRDFKRMGARNADMSLLKEVILALQKGEALEAKHRNHQLEGKWKDSFDCHIQPDWVLVYRTTDDAVILQAMGSHSDLFKQ